MSATRTEKDLLGTRDLPVDALWGIHTARALENFPLSGRPVHRGLVHAYGAVKLAAARANRELGAWDDTTATAIENACQEMIDGRLDNVMVVDALQGGAGTSTNMNVNEVLTNRALTLLDHAPGMYEVLDPLNDLNRHQSTNDTYPTALKVAAIQGLRQLEPELVRLVEAFQAQEQTMAGVVKVGRTQLQDAVLTTMGRSMSAFAEAFGRDRWRVFKCEERLRVVNLGGTAIGTGLSAPRSYIFAAVKHLKQITGLGLARGENLVDVTQNHDALVEVSGILNACAVNLLKVSGDLRLLASGPQAGLGELRLPPRQAGSSLMPGKVNPVIPEAVTQAALTVTANNHAVTQACAMGNLELNAFLPLVADALLGSIDLLTTACRLLTDFCIRDLAADPEACRRHVNGSTATLTALVGALGYDTAQSLAKQAADSGQDIRTTVIEAGAMSADTFDAAITPEAVMRLGSPESGTPNEDSP